MVVRTRFAPSPTGSLHIGGARTALYNYLLAKKMQGQFILRIEDTDKERNSQESLNNLLQELQWMGLNWDEGVDVKTQQSFGPHGPYQQSQRNDIYADYAKKLIDSGQAYYCFADEQTITDHKEAHADQPQIHFQSADRNQSLSDAKKRLDQGEKAVIRYKNTHEDETFSLNDLVRGNITLPGNMIGDFILLRADGSPVYNFCCAIDDSLMEITHVLRGEEHLPNTLRQLMIIDALGFKRPEYGHLSLILGEGNKKLSKRDGAASISDFQSQGYLHEGLINYLALLGWSDPDSREILSLTELEQAFSTDRLNPAAPHFDQLKLRWVNHQQIQAYDSKKLYQGCLPFLEKANLMLPQSEQWLENTLPLFQSDLHTLADICPIFTRLCDHSALLTDDAFDVLKWGHTPTLLRDWLSELFSQLTPATITIPADSGDYFTQCTLENPQLPEAVDFLIDSLSQDQHLDKILPHTLYQLIDQLFQSGPSELQTQLQSFLDINVYQSITKTLQNKHNVNGKELFMPLRVAMIGNNQGLDLKLACQLIPLGSLIKRAVYAVIATKNLT
ncbi:MAG: glutamate--tRNA ligase [Pseudomonadota bacterium]|nr:glutamate--tRNA ligase [Pseudomonadota bacterium]